MMNADFFKLLQKACRVLPRCPRPIDGFKQFELVAVFKDNRTHYNNLLKTKN